MRTIRAFLIGTLVMTSSEVGAAVGSYRGGCFLSSLAATVYCSKTFKDVELGVITITLVADPIATRA
jgi:hypothetical protein